MASNKEGFEKDVNIEIDDLLTHQAKLRQKAKEPKKKKSVPKAKASKKAD